MMDQQPSQQQDPPPPQKTPSNRNQRQDNLKEFNILLTPAFSAFSQIAEGLYLTGVGGMSLDNFRKNKITSIINCTHEAPNWRLSGVECMRVPVDDSPAEDLSPHLDRVADKINSTLTNGGRVVVHCVAGVSRSAAFVMAYLIKYRRMNLHDAFNHVYSCRRVVRPNNGFFKHLIAYEIKNLGTNSVKMVKLRREDVMIEIPDFFEAEHKKFVLLETFKAKASSLRAEAQTPTTSTARASVTASTSQNRISGTLKPHSPNRMGQSTSQTPQSGNHTTNPSTDQPPKP